MSSNRRWPRRLLIALGSVVFLCLVARLVLDPIASRVTRKAMNKMDGLRGDFDRVHVTLFGPGYTITHLKLIQDPGGSWKAPVVYAEWGTLQVIDWHRLLHGQVVATARIVEPKITVLNEPEPEKPKTAKRPPDLSTQLRSVTPLKIARVEILRGEMLFRDMTAPRHPELWIHHLDLSGREPSGREKYGAGARLTTLSASGVVERSGQNSRSSRVRRSLSRARSRLRDDLEFSAACASPSSTTSSSRRPSCRPRAGRWISTPSSPRRRAA